MERDTVCSQGSPIGDFFKRIPLNLLAGHNEGAIRWQDCRKPPSPSALTKEARRAPHGACAPGAGRGIRPHSPRWRELPCSRLGPRASHPEGGGRTVQKCYETIFI